MRARRLVRWLMVVGVLAFPAAGYTQEATVTGTVTDATSGVLPGVTITALHQASGNTFVASSRRHAAPPARLPVAAVRA